ncbi:DUF4214 domain-containing protein [Thiorhodococcus mannitoliphagus]|uniref:DUF4214 domain-containing protein n=1 Tax=Thiorhodococcus mannitoliphagus TaxID=329406 RepID=A0A6P1DU31_9GAMM|nr:DUF4214 domain-containing protein [Thiorhodococcus mannitoliphagus]NEX21827.1 DUF4214 domain-containing protein [Thiorhodococcus mannitoliphagus]
MATSIYESQVYTLFVAYFGRPPAPTGLAYYTGLMDSNGGDWAVIADDFFLSQESQDLFGGLSVEAQVNQIFLNTFGRDALPAGINYWAGEVVAGNIALPELAYTIAYNADAADIAVRDAKIDTAMMWVDSLDTTDELLAFTTDSGRQVAREFLATVDTAVPASQDAIDMAMEEMVDGGSSTGQEIFLTEVRDMGEGFTGGPGEDLFIADVVQNAAGLQVNTLGTGDRLDGGSGDDTLEAQLTEGAFAGGGNMPVQPRTTSIESVEIEALNSHISGSDFRDDDWVYRTEVYLNAKDMVDVERISSNYSDADLTVQDLTTLDSQGNMRPVSDMTVAMEYTGNRDSHWYESNFNVYFDQDYLNPSLSVTDETVIYELMNEDGYDADPTQPLKGVYVARLEFDLNGKTYDLADGLQTLFPDETQGGTGDQITTYAGMVDGLQQALALLVAAEPENAELARIEIQTAGNFFADISPVTGMQRVGQQISFTIPGLQEDGVSENTLVVSEFFAQLDPAEASTWPNSNRYERAEDLDPVVTQELRINVDLEKVGRAADGGELVIGSMSKTGDNVWDADYADKGIQIFDVTVHGGEAESSSLAGLRSTNNTLEEVYVTTAEADADDPANLTIGNSNTDWLWWDNEDFEWGSNKEALKDVRVFDSTAFLGDLTLYAALTGEVTPKYLDLQDIQGDPAADNISFNYLTGVGNDFLDITMSAENLADRGAATREDFDMATTIATGDGADEVRFAFIDEDNDGDFASDLALADNFGLANWYDNQKLNGNVLINTGDGEDTIWTPGSGDIIIQAGAGDDAIYVDDSAEGATWVFNTFSKLPVHTELENLQSDENDTYQIYKGQLTVDYRGFEVTVEVPSTNGITSDLQVNQAIKAAINEDPVLNELLVAYDGPANTLVVEALTDSNFGGLVTGDNPGVVINPGDLTITLSAPDAGDLSALEVSNLNLWYGSNASAAQLIATMEGEIADFNARGDYSTTFATDVDGDDMLGMFSYHTSDNTITPGTGDDVVVLGTGAQSNDTVVYEGYSNGTDSILNFDTSPDGNMVEIPVDPSVNSPETFVATFGDITPTGTATLAFDGVTVDLTDAGDTATLIPGVDVAQQFVAQYNASMGTTWIAEFVEDGSNQVKFTSTDPAAGDRDDIQADDFVYANADGAVTIGENVDGTDAYVPATAATLSVDLNGTVGVGGPTSVAIADGTFTVTYSLDGGATEKTIDVDYKAGDGPETLSEKLAAALDASPDWSAFVDYETGLPIVQVTAAKAGDFDVQTDLIDLSAAAIADADANGIQATIPESTNGADQKGTAAWIDTYEANGLDYLDFSSYNVDGIVVDSVDDDFDDAFFAGDSGSYVLLTEDSANLGSYEMKLYDDEGAQVDIIGVADFGATQDFVEQNFIIDIA